MHNLPFRSTTTIRDNRVYLVKKLHLPSLPMVGDGVAVGFVANMGKESAERQRQRLAKLVLGYSR